MTIVGLPSTPHLRTGARRQRRAGSVLAAWAQVGLALVIGLGSIGLASVAALIDPGAAPPPAAVVSSIGRAPAHAP